ncbi:MAG: hypothetical protein C4335_12445 [Armatimonadota bacterium]
MRRTWLLITVQILCLLARSLAREPTTAVVVVEGLTWQQLEQGEAGALYVLARHGTVGLMSVGAGGDTAFRFALTLQTGRRLALSREATPDALRKRYAHLRWLTDALARAGVRVTVYCRPPQEHLQALLAQPNAPAMPAAQVQIWWLRADPSTINQGVEQAIGSLNPERDRVLILGLPPSGERVAPVITAGGGLSPGVLTSATTRTPGLVSDMDIAPTLLEWHGVRPRVGEQTLRILQAQDAFSFVQQVARVCQWNMRGLLLIGALQVGGGLLAVFAGLGTIHRRSTSRRMRLLLSVAIGALLSLPAGTLLAPYLPAGAFWQYVGAIVLLAVWLSLLAHWGVWDEPFRAYLRACALSVLVILADGVSGQHGVRFSMYSAYALSGIRFYGIGNEMMGVLVGCALAWGLYARSVIVRAPLWIVVAIVLALPSWGANLGGWLTCATGLGVAWETTRAQGKPLLVRGGLWLMVGLLGAIGVMWLDSLGALPSHMGTAWLRWRADGRQAVVDTLSSKLALAVHVLTSPFAWEVLGAIALALWAMRRLGNGWHSEYTAWLACLLSAFVFNDSGFVPASAILGVGMGALLTRRLQEVYHGASE